MKIVGDTAYVGGIVGINPNGDLITVTENKGTKICLPLSTILRCYAIAKHECEKAGMDWDTECRRVLAQEAAIRESFEPTAP